MTIQDMTLEERPREKMILNGPDSLSDAELLAIIIRSGTQKLNAIQLGQAIIKKADNIRYLQDLTIEELKSINGIGETKAVQIKAALELSKRIASFKPEKYKIKNPWDIYKYYMESLRYQYKEIFKVVLLNTKNEIITDIDISIGTLNSSLVHPREVFREAIRRSSNKIILLQIICKLIFIFILIFYLYLANLLIRFMPNNFFKIILLFSIINITCFLFRNNFLIIMLTLFLLYSLKL